MKRLVLCAILLTLPMAAEAAKKCGSETCGTPTKGQKTIGGVVHNCNITKCSKSCCTLGDPPVCSNETTTTSDCSPARVTPKDKFKNLKAPPATTMER